MDETDQASTGAAEIPAVAGFWRRLLAFVIDAVVISAPAFLLGVFLFDFFASLGVWGRAVGFVVALLYFGLLNSSLSGGQTIGKKAAAIRVVGRTDEPVGVGRSFLRTAILITPYFLNGAIRDPAFVFSWIGIAVAVAVFGIGLSILYLLVFNRRNRRGLHDLLVGTRVVSSVQETGSPPAATWPGHFVVLALILTAATAAPLLLLRPLARSDLFRGLLQLQSAVMALPDVSSVSVMAGSTTVYGRPSRTTNGCDVSVLTHRRVADPDAFANQVARTVLERYPEARRLDAIGISVVYGYDLGIASAQMAQKFSYTPAQWDERIQNTAASSL